MIRLIGKVFVELTIFMIFFIFWQFVFAYLGRISGQDVDDGDYSNLSVNSIFILNTFRNSVGDLSPPGTKLWNFYIDDSIKKKVWNANTGPQEQEYLNPLHLADSNKA